MCFHPHPLFSSGTGDLLITDIHVVPNICRAGTLGSYRSLLRYHSLPHNTESSRQLPRITRASFLLKGPRKPGRLGCNAVGSGIACGLWCHICWTLCQHQPASNDGSVVLGLLLTGFPRLSFVVVFSKLLDGRRLLAHVTDHEWHREVA